MNGEKGCDLAKTGLKAVKDCLFPKITSDIKREINKQNIRNIHLISAIFALVETAMLVGVLVMTRIYDLQDVFAIANMAFCIVMCSVVFLIANSIRKKDLYRHKRILVISYVFSALFVAWAMMADFRHYAVGEQLIVFYTVIVVLVTFISVYPAVSLVLNLVSFITFYCVLSVYPGVTKPDVYNYFALCAVCCVIGVVRFHQQVNTGRRAVEMAEANSKLSFLYRHDYLTGLNNRAALSDDFPSYYDRPLTVVMSDIDYFKKINDAYGHLAGDTILKEVAQFILSYYPDAKTYRYGGDEFLLFLPDTNGEDAANRFGPQRSFEISVSVDPGRVRLSFGVASGQAADAEEMRTLVAEADQALYEIKRELHKND